MVTKEQLDAKFAEIVELGEKIKKLQAEFEKTWREAEEASQKAPAMIPEMVIGDDGFYVGGKFRGDVLTERAADDDDLNIFPTEEMAYGYAQAFKLMLQMRMQEGSGQTDENGKCWGMQKECFRDSLSVNYLVAENYLEVFSIVPPFPTEALLEQAVENCGGKEHVLNVMKFLAGIEKNVPKVSFLTNIRKGEER